MEALRFFTNSFGDRYLYEVNRNTFSHLGAKTQIERHLGKTLALPDTLHIIVGTDSGLLVRHVHDMKRPEGSKYLFVELPELLPVIREELGDITLDEQMALTSPEDWQEQLNKLNFSDYANIDAVLMYESLGATDAFLLEYARLIPTLRQQLDALRWEHNLRLGHPLFIKCQLENLIEAHVPAIRLKDAFPGKTAIVLGGGPSLDDIIPWLQANQEQLLILAVSRVCRRLQQAGIKPHIVVTIDPSPMSFDISREMLTMSPDIVLAWVNHAVPSLVTQWPGRSVYMGARLPWKSRNETDNLCVEGPTVTHAAIQLALEMGISRIILGGVDLCHDRQGNDYASGSNEREQGPRPPGMDIEVTTNAGFTTTTTPGFYNGIRGLEALAQKARARGARIVNPAPGAARMEGVDYTPIDGITPAPVDNAPLDTLHGLIHGDDPASRTENIRSMQRELARANGQIRRIEALTREALECNDKLFGRQGKPGDFKYKKRMDKIERQLDREHKDLSVLVRLFCARDLLRMPPSNREWTDEEIEQAGYTYYAAYQANALELLRLVEAAQERLDTALIEESQAPDIHRLVAQWEKDDVPGRAIVWQHRHPEAAAGLKPEERSRLEQLAQRFHARLKEKDTLHRKVIQKNFSLSGVRARLLTLFRRKDLEELQRLAGQLDAYDSPESRELKALAQGYASELQDQPETAFAHYAQLIELAQANPPEDGSHSPCLEDALAHMATIALNQQQTDRALLVLQTLTDLSPAYAPQFAELLRLSGHREEAALIYSDYLKQVPDDLPVMLRLGRLYHESGSDEAARTAFEYVLGKDPGNNDALTLLNELATPATDPQL